MSPDESGYPRTGTHSPYLTQSIRRGPGGQPPKTINNLRSGRLERGSGGSGHTRHTARCQPRQAECNNGAREKAVVKPNGTAARKKVRFATKGWEGNTRLCRRPIWQHRRHPASTPANEWLGTRFRAGMKPGAATRRGLPETRRRGDSRTLAGYCHNQPRPRWGSLHWLLQGFCC